MSKVFELRSNAEVQFMIIIPTRLYLQQYHVMAPNPVVIKKIILPIHVT